jgi:hypothetical protein
LNIRSEEIGDAALAGAVFFLVVVDVGKDASFVYCYPIFEMGGAWGLAKVFLRRRIKPVGLGKTGAFVLDAIQGANAVLRLMQAGDLSGLLIMSVKGLISCDPSVIAMIPDKSNNATGPSGAMIVLCERDVVLLQVHVLMFCPSNRPSAENHLIPPDT